MDMTHSRTLTHDEIKASEAAFQGLPFNPQWSRSAKLVYDGILGALGHAPPETAADGQASPDDTSQEPAPRTQEPVASGSSEEEETDDLSMLTLTTGAFPLTCRKDAIKSGLVKDATPAARRVGLEYPVGLTNTLWEHYVASSEELQDEHIHTRLQDIMTGIRLRLACIKEPVPFIDVPVLFSVGPQAVPDIHLVFALFHWDPEEGQCLLLIHPNEIFSPRQNIPHN